MASACHLQLIWLVLCGALWRSCADVSHFYPHHDFAFFQQHPFQFALQPVALAPPPSATLPTLYGAPPAESDEPAGYPEPVTHAPVAPTAGTTTTTTTDFVLPEIIENRSLKHAQQHQQHQQHYHHHFIPLSNQYLPPVATPAPVPPTAERPNYESPGGYYYPRPSTTTTTTTTSERPPPIVVAEPPLALPPFGERPGYDYNAPPGPVLPPSLVAPSSTPAPAYLPPAANSGAGDEETVVEQLDPNTPPLRLRIKEMRCLQQGAAAGGGYFRSVLKVNSFIGATPTIEDSDAYDKRCEPKLSRSYVVLDLAEEDFGRCGVRTCGKDLCLRLRFPALRGMRTGWDAILTLHCRTQERVAVKTHALKMGVANEAQARSLGTYARGGSQNHFRTHVELLRRSGGGAAGSYTRLSDSPGGNAVQLGEELLLRAHVIPGDGWNYTKLSDVSLQRISNAGELLNSAQLINAHGCNNPAMQSVCAQPPAYDPPLGQRLSFRAVMFSGMRSGDELVLAMRITGCLEQQDCQLAAPECLSEATALGRRRRDTAEELDTLAGAQQAGNSTEMSEMTRISFRVILPADAERPLSPVEEGDEERHLYVTTRTLALAGSLCFVALLAALGALIMWRFKKFM